MHGAKVKIANSLSERRNNPQPILGIPVKNTGQVFSTCHPKER